MIYEHPLAYLLGIEGMALMRAFTGERDRTFVEARLAEVRRLLDAPELEGAGVEVERVDTVDGYREWARTYDSPQNGLFALDSPLVYDILQRRSLETVLDAACGTGRLAEIAAAAGHRVVGVDTSPDMLSRARERVPSARFLLGDLHDLPVGDGAADVVVSGLALCHVPDLAPVFAQFERVLRPGGQLVVSDVHPEHVAMGFVPPVTEANGGLGRISTYRHRTGDYVRAAVSSGFRVVGCDELPEPQADDESNSSDPIPDDLDLGPWDVWPWSLADLLPDAARAAMDGKPSVIVWHFELDN